MASLPDSEAQRAMGARLQAIRQALGLSQEDMASKMGVVVTTLSAWESGRNQIDIVKLAKSATRWGFTTDWVALGDLSGLRRDLADKLEAVAAAPPTLRPGRPRKAAKPAPAPHSQATHQQHLRDERGERLPRFQWQRRPNVVDES